MKTELSISSKVLIFTSYIFFLPSLYLILTERRKDEEIARHSSQALLLWIAIFLIVIVLKKLIFIVLSYVSIPYLYLLNQIIFSFLWIYCLYCAFLFFLDKKVDIPLISKIADRIA